MARPETAERIASFLTLKGYKNALEVGPGAGILTQYLIPRLKQLVAVEYDFDMIPILDEKFKQTNFELIQGDFVRVDISPFFGEEPFALIGNFPYNISSQIVFKMLDHIERIPELVGMFQKEMAERILADHGSKKYGVISVLTQAFYSGEPMMTLKPGSFNPPPRVNSMVIRLRRKEILPDVPYKTLRTVVKGAFSQRRKKMSNSLKGVVDKELLIEMDLADLRAEHIPVETFINLTKKVISRRKA